MGTFTGLILVGQKIIKEGLDFCSGRLASWSNR